MDEMCTSTAGMYKMWKSMEATAEMFHDNLHMEQMYKLQEGIGVMCKSSEDLDKMCNSSARAWMSMCKSNEDLNDHDM